MENLTKDDFMNLFKIDQLDKIIFIENEYEIKQWLSNVEQRDNCGQILKGKVCVYSNEGYNVPHFHIIRYSHPDCCIKIKTNEYFIHGNHTGTLNKKETKILYKWLHEDSNWIHIINVWNKHVQDERYIVPVNLPIPDYRLLNSTDDI